MKTNQWWMAATLLVAGACSDSKHHDFDGVGGGSAKDGGTKLADGKVVVEDVCGRHIVTSDHAVPDMLIVLDRSGSMAPGGNATRTDRWSGSRDAVDDVTSMFDATINFGLMTFPGNAPFGGGGGRNNGGGLAGTAQCAAGGVDVNIGPGNGQAISSALGRMNANGYTPTAATLTAALDVIGQPTSADQKVTAAKYVLLVTDGDPNCSEDFTGIGGIGGIAPPDPTARKETLEAIKKLTDAGVQTYVVGFQTAQTDFASVLDQMAQAGGTGEDHHQSVESGDELSSVFESLAGQAASCTYHLSQKVFENEISVTVGGKSTAESSSQGWTLGQDGQTVTLHGSPCDDAKHGKAFIVAVDCGEVIGI